MSLPASKLYTPEVLPIPPQKVDEGSLKKFHEDLFNYLRRLEVSSGKVINRAVAELEDTITASVAGMSGGVLTDKLVKVTQTGTVSLSSEDHRGRSLIIAAHSSGSDSWYAMLSSVYTKIIDENPAGDVSFNFGPATGTSLWLIVDKDTGGLSLNCDSYMGGGGGEYVRIVVWGTVKKLLAGPDLTL